MPDLKNTCALCMKPMDDDGEVDVMSHDYLCTCPYPVRTATLKTIGTVPSTFLGRLALAGKLAVIGVRAAMKTMREPDRSREENDAYIVAHIKLVDCGDRHAPKNWPVVSGYACGDALLLDDQLVQMSRLVRSTEYGMHTDVNLQAGFTDNYELPLL